MEGICLFLCSHLVNLPEKSERTTHRESMRDNIHRMPSYERNLEFPFEFLDHCTVAGAINLRVPSIEGSMAVDQLRRKCSEFHPVHQDQNRT